MNNLNIIVIDDNQEYAKSIAKILTVNGYGIKGKVVANQDNFNQALKIPGWDLIFIKLGLEEPVDIQEVTTSIEAKKLGIPVIAISGSANEEIREEVIKAGAKELVSLESPEFLTSIVSQQTNNVSPELENKATTEQQVASNAATDVTPDSESTLTIDEKLMCTQIQAALDNNQFVTVYQPIVNLDAKPSENYEVLMRMLDKQGSEIAPNDFISSAEKGGMMGAIDRWVIERSIQLILKRREVGNKTRLFIKLSNNSICDPDLWLWLSEKLMAAKLPKSSIVFEITEADAFENKSSTKKLIPTLKRLNCRVALDHVGLNTEAQEFWSKLDLDYIKISGKLILGMIDSVKDNDKVRDIASFAKKNNILTIAQFIQEAGVMTHLYHHSINYVQGNFLQGPEAAFNYEFE